MPINRSDSWKQKQGVGLRFSACLRRHGHADCMDWNLGLPRSLPGGARSKSGNLHAWLVAVCELDAARNERFADRIERGDLGRFMARALTNRWSDTKAPPPPIAELAPMNSDTSRAHVIRTIRTTRLQVSRPQT